MTREKEEKPPIFKRQYVLNMNFMFLRFGVYFWLETWSFIAVCVTEVQLKKNHVRMTLKRMQHKRIAAFWKPRQEATTGKGYWEVDRRVTSRPGGHRFKENLWKEGLWRVSSPSLLSPLSHSFPPFSHGSHPLCHDTPFSIPSTSILDQPQTRPCCSCSHVRSCTQRGREKRGKGFSGFSDPNLERTTLTVVERALSWVKAVRWTHRMRMKYVVHHCMQKRTRSSIDRWDRREKEENSRHFLLSSIKADFIFFHFDLPLNSCNTPENGVNRWIHCSLWSNKIATESIPFLFFRPSSSWNK